MKNIQNLEDQSITWRNRLVSLFFIALVWFFVRVLSEFHGISWERFFYWSLPVWVGAIPMSVGLLIAAFARNKNDQRWYRCFAFWSFPIALITDIIFQDISNVNSLLASYELWTQFVAFFLIQFIYHH
jgi:hypothetical protein